MFFTCFFFPISLFTAFAFLTYLINEYEMLLSLKFFTTFPKKKKKTFLQFQNLNFCYILKF